MSRKHPGVGKTLWTSGLRLAALEWGAGEARKVLALHGWMDNAASFVPLAPLLEGCHLVAVDLPGHGCSGHRPRGVPYHFIDYAANVLGAADALGWDRFELLGHSLGAGIAAVTAAVAVRRVQRLVLIEGIGPVTASDKTIAEQLGTAIAQMARGHGGSARRYSTLAEVVEARCKIGQMTAEAAALLVRRNLVHGADGYRWRTDRRLLFQSPLYLAESQVHDFLRRIDCPALLVLGSQAQVVPAAYVARRRKLIRGLQVVRLAGGHHLHIDDPAAVADAIHLFNRANTPQRKP